MKNKKIFRNKKDIVLGIMLAIIIVSGCSTREAMNGTEETTYVYTNITENMSVGDLTGGENLGFVFRLYFDSIELPPNKTFEVPVIFNNIEGDKNTHKFVSRFFPSGVDFNVKAAYLCEWFQSCTELKEDMTLWLTENETQIEVDYGFVGITETAFSIPEDAPKGTYIYTAIACKDIAYENCTQATSNWGPSNLFTITVE